MFCCCKRNTKEGVAAHAPNLTLVPVMTSRVLLDCRWSRDYRKLRLSSVLVRPWTLFKALQNIEVRVTSFFIIHQAEKYLTAKIFISVHFAAGNCSCSAVSVVFASHFHKLQNHFIFTFFSGTIKKRFGVWRFTVVIRSSHPPATTARLSSATEKSTS